jgi:predicted regulator of Ras-like GTPase activity (Roadblock/LC7/MglB family)
MYMFKETLKGLVESADGGLAGLIMDATGIALESYTKEGSNLDINTIGIEFSVVIGSVKRASEMLEAGGTREVAITTDKLTTLIRCLDENYFLALTLQPHGNIGRGRYLLRIAAPKLLAEL